MFFFYWLDVDPLQKLDQRATDDESNNRSASDYLSKILKSRDLSNDLDSSIPNMTGSEPHSFSYNQMKSSSAPNTRSSSSQFKTSHTHQKRNSRSANSNRHNPAEVSSIKVFVCFTIYMFYAYKYLHICYQGLWVEFCWFFIF